MNFSRYWKHPEFKDAAVGLEGMKAADGILKNKKAPGVLIGGLAETIWSQKTKIEDLLKHKDVDVAVLDKKFALTEPFEGGIDWWLPETCKITTLSPWHYMHEIDITRHTNGNGITLSFGIGMMRALEPGLYIPGAEWVVDMRAAEALANMECGVDDDVFEKFHREIRNKIKTRLPGFIRDNFRGQILSQTYEEDWKKRNAVYLDWWSPEKIKAINSGV